MNDENRAQPYSLENMSIPELESLLQKNFDATISEDNPSNLDYMIKISEVIEKKKEAAGTAVSVDVGQAWEDFQNFHMENTLIKEEFPEAPPSDARRQSHRRSWRKAWVTAGMAAVLVCLLAVSVSADFRTWIRETYEGSFVYRFFNAEIPDAVLPDYEITDLPEGYELVVNDSDDGLGMKLYGLGDSKIGLMYWRADDSGNFTIFSTEDHQYQHSAVSIHGISADLYMADDVTLPNELVWIDEQNSIGFQLSCFFDSSLMIKLAESVSAINR